MKKVLFAAALLLVSCGQSQEEKDMTDAVYQKYKSEQIDTDTSVPFNILNLDVTAMRTNADTTFYEVEFDIQEMHPSKRFYYKGSTSIYRIGDGEYNVGELEYTENTRLNK